jgi:hypothetical protein
VWKFAFSKIKRFLFLPTKQRHQGSLAASRAFSDNKLRPRFFWPLEAAPADNEVAYTPPDYAAVVTVEELIVALHQILRKAPLKRHQNHKGTQKRHRCVPFLGAFVKGTYKRHHRVTWCLCRSRRKAQKKASNKGTGKGTKQRHQKKAPDVRWVLKEGTKKGTKKSTGFTIIYGSL